MLYIKQVDGFRLGNFINLTPTIRALAETLGHKIPVHFETNYVKQCFIDCDFIEHIGPQKHKPLFDSGFVCKANIMPDYEFVFESFKARFKLGEMPHTYIDTGKELESTHKNFILLMNGTGNQDKDYIASKDPGIKVFKHILDSLNNNVVFTGSEEDYQRAQSYLNGAPAYCNDIRRSLRLIYDADFIIANDTGLAHAAAAMNKSLFLLWKDTKFPKNSNPGKETIYIFKDEWLTFPLFSI